MTDKQVFQDAYFTVLVDERRSIVRTVRSSTPFASLEELDGIFARLGAALDALGRSRYALLADLRAGPGRNDPEFEAVMERHHRPRWTGGFRKVGVLVRSNVGLMQIQRHARTDGFERMISKDEDELLKYLTQDD
ncbi:hypothetical protein JRI60_43495 [Archangium violaceum]|uniref:hypothetical protein n=1 Tax=Archangium violaceum TaxID=83451 RepID=UPI00194E7DCC|nr:hypothetical protein [Archangium violaceum]QRN95841.1 hypothetical protein JRI60_43495 [Archangium violaceum]